MLRLKELREERKLNMRQAAKSLGIPDKYAMERGGWSSPHIMKQVYQHTFTAERQAVDKRIDDFFNNQLHT